MFKIILQHNLDAHHFLPQSYCVFAIKLIKFSISFPVATYILYDQRG
jgi:hypothetical protein